MAHDRDDPGDRGEPRVLPVLGLQIAEGRDASHEPVVVVHLRFGFDKQILETDHEGRLIVSFEPDAADFTAEELQRWARRARETQRPDGGR